MKLDKNIDSVLRKLFDFKKFTNISAEDLKRVDVLSLENLPIDSLEDLKNMPNLRSLNISGTKVKDISPLAYTHQLEKLAMYKTEVNDISVLSQLNELKELYMSMKISDVEKRLITSLNSLTLLVVTIADEGLKFISRLTSLKVLYISSKHIDLSELENMNNLEYLEIDAKSVINWKSLLNFQNLQEVIYIDFNKKDREYLIENGIQANMVIDTSPIDPVFISNLNKFHLDSRLKNDSYDMLKAMSVISILVLLIIYGIVIFNPNATINFWQGTLYGLLFFIVVAIPLFLCLRIMHFELYFTDNGIRLEKAFKTYNIEFEEILLVKKIIYPGFVQPKVHIKTKRGTHRLKCSNFTSNKKLQIMLKEFEKLGVDTESIQK